MSVLSGSIGGCGSLGAGCPLAVLWAVLRDAPALADTLDAGCDTSPRGDHARAPLSCTFSRRQGQVVIRRQECIVYAPDGGRLTRGRQGDEWYIGIDGQALCRVPVAAIEGGGAGRVRPLKSKRAGAYTTWPAHHPDDQAH